MASILIVMDLWVTLPKIKIKEAKAKDWRHNHTSNSFIKT